MPKKYAMQTQKFNSVTKKGGKTELNTSEKSTKSPLSI